MDLPYPSKGNSYPEASLTVELMFSLCVMATGRVVENLIDSDGTCLISGLVLLSIPRLVRLKLVKEVEYLTLMMHVYVVLVGLPCE